MKIPRLKLRNSTKGALAGVLIALGSLYALAISYNIPRETLISFLIGSILFVLAMMLLAVAVVVVFKLIARLISGLIGKKDPEED